MSKPITISKDKLKAQISTSGAELISLQYKQQEYIWQADPSYWGRHAPILFPIVGSLRNNEAQSAAGICHMSRHGFARDKNFEIQDLSADHLSLELKSGPQTLAVYPYHFCLVISYALETNDATCANTLRQSFTVTNTGNEDMPFCLGGHPAFNIPAPKDQGLWEDYELIFSKPWTYESPIVTQGGLWDYSTKVPVVCNTDHLALSRDLFAHDTIELEGTPDNTVTVGCKQAKPYLRVDFPGFSHLGIWSAGGQDGRAPFLAIEPWCGTATRTDEDDIFEHKQDILVATAGQSVTRSFSITLF